jgi:hypothetical protein
MPNGMLSLALAVVMQVGSPGPSENPYTPAPPTAYGRYGSEGSSEQRFPFDTQRNWVHGYFQEIPSYGGHPVFRPYNYKDVLAQSQTAAGWGERPMMPYSQQFWHKYHDQATMLKTTYYAPMPAQPLWNAPQQANPSIQSYSGWSAAPGLGTVIPQSAAPVTAGSYQVPPQNFNGVPDQSRNLMPPTTTEIVNPTAYQSYNSRGY